MSKKMSMMIKEKIKHANWIFKLYSFGGSLAINFLKLFVSTDPKLILFNSFGGKKCDDSPKAIYDKMKKDPRFSGYELVWAFHNPSDFPEVEKKIQTDGLHYFITALKARCWVSNSSIQRGLVFKGKETFSFNTWHGSPIKSMANGEENGRKNNVMDMCDVILAQSEFEVKAFVHDWHLKPEKYRIYGYPRNDRLANYDFSEKEELRRRMGIPDNNVVVLYAPTFRDYLLDDASRCTLEVPFDYKYWEKVFPNHLTFIMRMHYEVAKHNKLPNNSMWMDMSDYPNLNDLMIVSDILISDYSSIIFDYSIMGKPIINYLYDYDEYKTKRGLWIEIKNEFPFATDSQKLADMTKDSIENPNEYKAITCQFRDEYVEEFGSATDLSLECIFNAISSDKNNIEQEKTRR